jgi:alkylmercury lyase
MTEKLALYTGLVDGDQPLALAPYVVRLVAEGAPVPLARVAAASGWPEEKVTTALRSFPRVDWDERGRLLGLGLTLRATPHRFLLEGQTLYAWCAVDTLVFPVLLGKQARVESVCPVTATPISLTVTPTGVADLNPGDTMVVEMPPTAGEPDLRSTVCDQTHFLAGAQAVTEWRAAHPHGQVAAVPEAFDRTRARITGLGWAAENMR